MANDLASDGYEFASDRYDKMTYRRCGQSGLKLPLISLGFLDLRSRKVIGWSMRDSLEQTLVHKALEMALGQRLSTAVSGELLFHSDRGSRVPLGQTRPMTIRGGFRPLASCAV